MKFAEGDVFFDDTYPYDSVPMLFAQENILRPMVLDKFSKLYPSERKRVNWLRREIRTRKTVMLPVYFLDKPKNGSNVYFMVNGQTGAVAAIGRGEMKNSFCTGPGCKHDGRNYDSDGFSAGYSEFGKYI